jgi:hypothetical protein
VASCTGTIIVRITSSSSGPRPGNRSFANANPAVVAKTTVVTVITPATRKLLNSDSANCTSWFAKSADTLCDRRSPGVSGGGVCAIWSFVRDAITSIQYSGKTDSTSVTTRTR